MSGDVAYSTGISVKFGVDLSGLTSGISNAKSTLSSFVDDAVSMSGSISEAFASAFSGLSNIPSLDMSGLGVGATADELSSLGADAETTAEDLTNLEDASSGVSEELSNAGSGASSFRDSLNMISSSLQELASNVGGVVSGRLDNLVSRIQSLSSSINIAVSGPINNFVSGMQNLASSIGGAASDRLDSFVSGVQSLSSSISSMASSALNNFVSGVQSLASTVSDAVSGPLNSFVSGVQLVGSIINDTVSGPLNAFSSSVQLVASVISDTATGAVNSFVGGVQSVASTINDAVSGPINSFVSGVQQVGSNISDAVSGPINSFVSGVQRVSSTVSDAVSGPFNAFMGSIRSFASDISDAASGPLGNLISGIQSLSSNINEATSGALSSFNDGIKNTASSMMDMVQQTVTVTGNFSDFKQGISDAFSGISSFAGGIGDAASGVMDFVNNLGMGIMSLQMIGQQAMSTAQSLLGPAVSAETMKTAFTTLMGSTKAATDELNNLDAFASKTPFKTMDIDQAASQMLGFGFNAQSIVPTLTSIGDALSAVGKGSVANLDQIVGIFGKIQSNSKITGQDMTQFSNDGINAWAVLEQQTGKTKAQLTTMISGGLLPAKDAMSMLTKGIEANPLYAGGMAKQSATTAGLLSTLSSNWNQLMVAFGTPIIQALEGSLNNIGNALSSPGFKSFAGSVGQGIANAFKDIGNYLKSADFKTFVDNMSSLGTQLSPIVTALKPVATSIFSSIGPALKTGVTDIGNFSKGIGGIIKFFKDGSLPAQILGLAILGIAAGLTAMKVTQFISALPGLITQLGIWAAAQWTVAVPTLITSGLFILIGIVVVLVIAGIIAAVMNWGKIAHWLQGVWADIASFFGWLWGQISGFFVGVGKWFADRFTEAYNGVVGAIGGIGNWFQGIWKDIQGAFGAVGNWFHNIWTTVTTDFQNVLGGLGAIATNIWNGITGGVKAAFNWIIDQINGVIGHIDSIKVAGFGINIPLIPHLASGVENFIGGTALVGEEGPELVTLPRGANVLNAASTASMFGDLNNFKYPSGGSGGGSQNIHVHIHLNPEISIDKQKLTKAIGDDIGKHVVKQIRVQGGVKK